MARKWTLHEAVGEWVKSMRVGGEKTHSTIARKQGTMWHLEAITGRKIQPKNITPLHLEKVYQRLAPTNGPGSLNVHRSNLTDFFRWCRDQHITPATHHPCVRKGWKALKPKKFMLDVNEFATLLDNARTPRDRVLMALGLYLFLRASEIRSLKLSDLDLDRGEIDVTVWKTKERDVMPVSIELEAELRRWLTHYSTEVGPLKPNYHLVPGRKLETVAYCPVAGHFVTLDSEQEKLFPLKPVARLERVVGYTLREMGYPATDEETGDKNREGIHILRRSGARALFDALRAEGYDGSLQRVRAMLHHATVSITEHYLDLTVERSQRDDMFRRKAMFPQLATVDRSNVVELPAARKAG